MGKDTSGKTGSNALNAVPFSGTRYDKPGMTVETYAILNSAREDYDASFDLIDELLGTVVGSGARDLRIRYDTFLKHRAEGGILLGYAIPKLTQNLDEFKAGVAPTPPQEGEPGSELAKGGIYEIWFAHTGDWYKGRAENLDTRAGGKFEHAVDLEKRPSDSDIEKLPDDEFSKVYGLTKEGFRQKDGVTFEKKYGGDKVWFLRNHVLKRLAWEEDMMLKEIENSIYTHSTQYGPSAQAPTASWIVSHVVGLSCGERVDFSVLASDPKAREGITLDPDGVERERYWKLVDEKLKDARFMGDDAFSKKWETSKDAFVDEIVPKLHDVYDKFIAGKVASMDVEELKGRYYLSELRGDELIGELLGGTHSVRERVAELESQRNKLTRYMTGLSRMRADFEKKVDERDESRDKKLVELKHGMLELERAYPEIAGAINEIAKEVFDSKADGTSVLKRKEYNPYLMLLSGRKELIEDKEKLEKFLPRLEALKHLVGTPGASYLNSQILEDELRQIDTTKGRELSEGVVANDKDIAERLLDIAKYRDIEAEKIKFEKVSKKTGYELDLQEIEAAEEKWREKASTTIGAYLEEKQKKLGALPSKLEVLENSIEKFEKERGIEDYRKLKARQREMETEFPVGDKSKSATEVMVIRKLAFDALAKVEESMGKKEYRKLEARRKELKENPDPALREAARKEIGIIEERLGLAPYKKLEERKKEIESEIQRRLGTGTYKWIKSRKEELEHLIDVTELDTNKEYRGFKAHGEKLEENIRKAAFGEIETLEKELGITGYTDIETAEKRLNDRIDELKKTQSIPGEIEAKRKEIESKEDSLKNLMVEIEDLENKFGIQGYANAGLEERIRYLKENLPRDPQLRKIALAGMKSSTGNDPNSKGVSITGIEDIEHAFESVKYDKNRLAKEIGELEGKLPKDLKLELDEIENLEKAKEQARRAKEKWMATHGVEAFEKWKDEHGVTAYKSLVNEEKIIEKTRTNDYWALKEAHDTMSKINVTLNAVDLELGYLKNRLSDDRQLPELRDMLWGRGKYSDAPVSMAVFDGLYKEIEAQLPDESKKLVGMARENIKKRTEWMGSPLSVRDQRKLAAERAAFEFDVLSPKRLFGWDSLAKGGDHSEFGEFLKKGFGIELPENARVETADSGKTVNVHDGDKQIMSVSLYNHDELAMVETADGRIEMNLLARTDPKTGELVIFPHERPDIIMKKMYERAHTKKKPQSRE